METIVSALRNAYCPLRLRFAVYQEVSNYNDDVFPMAMAYASKEEQRMLNTNLRVVTMDSAATKGPLWAYRQLLERAYQGETYTCILAPGVHAGTFWDKVLLERSATNKMHVLTMCPQRKNRLVIDSNVSQTSLQRWMQSMSRNMQQTANNASSISTYPIITKFNGWIPVVSQRAFSQPPSSRCAALPCRVTWSLVARNCFSGPSEHSIGHWQLRRGLCPVHLVPRSWRFVLRGERQFDRVHAAHAPAAFLPSVEVGRERVGQTLEAAPVHGLCRCGFEGAHRIGKGPLGADTHVRSTRS